MLLDDELPVGAAVGVAYVLHLVSVHVAEQSRRHSRSVFFVICLIQSCIFHAGRLLYVIQGYIHIRRLQQLHKYRYSMRISPYLTILNVLNEQVSSQRALQHELSRSALSYYLCTCFTSAGCLAAQRMMVLVSTDTCYFV